MFRGLERGSKGRRVGAPRLVGISILVVQVRVVLRLQDQEGGSRDGFYYMRQSSLKLVNRLFISVTDVNLLWKTTSRAFVLWRIRVADTT